MPTVTANEIKLEYQLEGPGDGPVLLMVMGLASQLIAWPQPMLDGLHRAGIRTLRFDNRDVGLSQKMDHLRAPNLVVQAVLAPLRLAPKPPYDLMDMAGDAVALLDALALPHVHVAGFSMGGMIAQLLAARHPDRVASLTALSTSTNNPLRHGPRADVRRAMLTPQARTAEDSTLIERSTAFMRLISSQGLGQTEAKIRAEVSAQFYRNRSAAGQLRQMAAIIGTGDFTRQSRRITAPTLVIHGDADPLVNVAGARAVAAAVPGAKLQIMPSIGHDFPPDMLGHITTLMVDHIRSATSKTKGVLPGANCIT